jgi:hypothetical protein
MELQKIGIKSCRSCSGRFLIDSAGRLREFDEALCQFVVVDSRYDYQQVFSGDSSLMVLVDSEDHIYYWFTNGYRADESISKLPWDGDSAFPVRQPCLVGRGAISAGAIGRDFVVAISDGQVFWWGKGEIGTTICGEKSRSWDGHQDMLGNFVANNPILVDKSQTWIEVKAIANSWYAVSDNGLVKIFGDSGRLSSVDGWSNYKWKSILFDDKSNFLGLLSDGRLARILTAGNIFDEKSRLQMSIQDDWKSTHFGVHGTYAIDIDGFVWDVSDLKNASGVLVDSSQTWRSIWEIRSPYGGRNYRLLFEDELTNLWVSDVLGPQIDGRVSSNQPTRRSLDGFNGGAKEWNELQNEFHWL